MRALTRSLVASPFRFKPITTTTTPRPKTSRIAIAITLPSLLHSPRRHFVMAAQQSESSTPPNITPESLQETLKEKLEATYTTIEDISGGCGQAFNAIIVSPQFIKKNTLARHRLVNNALKQEIGLIHAWSPKCFSPEEWEGRNKTTS